MIKTVKLNKSAGLVLYCLRFEVVVVGGEGGRPQ